MELGSKRKLVVTRKDHKCLGCSGDIEKGDEAVLHTGKTDEKSFRYYLHVECNHFVMKHKVYMEEQVWTNCVHDVKKDFENMGGILET